MKRILFSTAVALGTFGGAAHAQDAGTASNDEFCSENAAFVGGSWQPAEGSPGLAPDEVFSAMDTDGDGMVSQGEYAACREAAAAGMSAGARSSENMAEADDDADGVITREEFLAAAAQAHVAASAAGGQGPAWLPLQRYVAVPTDATFDPEMSEEDVQAGAEASFSSLDADGNDELSPEEWAAASSEAGDAGEAVAADFEALDVDGSGTLESEEFQAAGGAASGGDDT